MAETILKSSNLEPQAADGAAVSPDAGARGADARIDAAPGGAGRTIFEQIKAYPKVPVWLREPVFVQIAGAGFTVYGAEDITEPVLVYQPIADVIANKRSQERLAHVRSRELSASSSYASIAQVPERGA